MFGAFEWMLAMRYLRARRQEGFISVIAWFSLVGIALGVATLIIVMAVMNGFRAELMSRILGLNGHLTYYGQSRVLKDFDPIAIKIEKVKGVISVTPMVEGQVMVTNRGVAKGALVRGLRVEDLAKRSMLADNIKAGTLGNFNGNSAIIGDRLARSLGVTIGDKITLISPKGNVTAFGTMPRMRAYKVAALYHIGMYEYDSGFVFIPLDAAQLYFRTGKGVSNLEIFVEDPDKVNRLKSKVMEAAGFKGRMHDWQQANASFFNAIKVERNVMFLILTLIIVVAAFNIVSSMIMMVQTKGKDIAILRTMGSTSGMVMRVFFLSGASVGVIGTLAGVGLGLAFSLNIETIRQWIQGLTGTDLFAAEIYFLSQLPARVEAGEVISVVLMGLILTFLATLYPSWRASKIDPADALRYE
ncbi:MAG: lipoprotein-releasing ABC transporter permease subunit [Rhodospirillaceae bacterium]|jgi:lipoprotein-releasing system permease protein|nr:lipoprotein-releasing ABC transporter permease subunit [Rhodospirillaceae bacterium]